ncbi:MAG: cellulase family glycosylhydrolase [Spirochaetia bacterium]
MNKSVTIKGNRFIDHKGNHLILHGMNMVCKDKDRAYIGPWDVHDFEKLKHWGFNVIRLGIIWDGLEPEPGVYDHNYLSKIDQFIQFAKAMDIYVYLDMHQDLFSCRFADGAPAWATLTDQLPHIDDGDIWSDAYFTSPSVQRSFDNFWNNKEAPDGKGIQTHYIELWQMVANRYKSEPNVIGYDVMNEPFVGSSANDIMELLFRRFAEKFIATDEESVPPETDLSRMWLDGESKKALLEKLGDSENYAMLIDAAEEELKAFDRKKIMPFYHRVTHAIREVDKESLIFLETNYFGNLGVLTGIDPVLDQKGTRMSNQVYAPHGYDLVTDTDFMNDANLSRINLIFKRHFQTSQRLKMPMMIGEWGAYQGQPGLDAQAMHTANLFEKYLCSDTYWCYDEKINFETHAFFKGIHRSYPMRIVGEIKRYGNTDTEFHCNWQENGTLNEENIFYIKDVRAIDAKDIILEPHGSYQIIENEKNNSGYIKVATLGKESSREMIINKARNARKI